MTITDDSFAVRDPKGAHAQIRELAHELGERVKELNCLYGISKLVEIPGISLGEILQGTVDLVPSGWQYPDRTCARIVLEGQEFRTGNYQETRWQQTGEIRVHGKARGKVQVGYLADKRGSGHSSQETDPFLVEEGELLHAIAERLGKITERKRAEEALAQQEAELRATLYGIGDAIISTDVQGRVVRLNSVAEQLTGWTEAEAAGRQLEALLSIVSEETQRPVEDPVARVLREGTVADLTSHTLHIAKSGQVIPVADSGSPIFDSGGNATGVVLVFRDQTEERMARRFTDTRLSLIEHAAGHTLDELLTRALDEVGAFVDSPIGFYHFVEPDQTTLSLQQWSTRTLEEFCRAEGKGTHYDIDQAGVWVDCVHEKQPVIHNDYASLSHKKGMPEGHAEVKRELLVPVMREDKVVAILGVGNKPVDYTRSDVKVVSYLADVTWEIVQQKRAEQALQQAKEAAEAANRAKSRFLANMGHELRTPLHAVLGFSELIQDDGNLTAEQQDKLVSIRRSGEHLLALINDVLELAKIEAGRSELQPANFDLHQILQGLEEMYRQRAERKGLQLTLRCAPDVPRFVRTDPHKLRQVLINLLGNAVKFTHQGSIDLQASRASEQPPAGQGQDPKARAPQVTLLFEVRDTGEGIARHEMEAVFDAFAQTESGKRSQIGTGLGLALSREYVRLMGGDLSLRSEVSVGTAFYLELPVEEVDAADVDGTAPRRWFAEPEAGQPPENALFSYDQVDVPLQQAADGDRDPGAAMAMLPGDLRTRLKTAAELCDMEAVSQVVADIGSHNLSLAGTLAALADDFAYDQILALMERTRYGDGQAG